MKKTLVFAMAMALGVSATAFAANPFSDLPAGHWAYASVAKLAAAGIVDGYPDGTFKGGRTMTRYEMAQIVAKALAKGAIGADDKLVGEFADELDNLGVRVAKLEKNADNVKITGNIRTHYADESGDLGANNSSKIRSRLFLTGEVNDNWHYVGMLQNEQNLLNDDGDSTTRFQRAYLDGNIGAVKLTLGRQNETMVDGDVYDTRVDAIKAVVGKDVKFTAAYGKMADNDGAFDTYTQMSLFNTTTGAYLGNTLIPGSSKAGKYWRAALNGDLGKVGLEANYISAKDVYSMGMGGQDDKIWTVGAKYKADNWNLGATYLKGSNDVIDALGTSQTGYTIALGIMGAKASKPGSFGFDAKYYNQGASTVIAHTMNGRYGAFAGEGFKGYKLAGYYTVAKNMVAGVEYYDLKGKETDNSAKTLWSQLVVTF